MPRSSCHRATPPRWRPHSSRALDPVIAEALRSRGPAQAAPYTWEAAAAAHVAVYRRAATDGAR